MGKNIKGNGAELGQEHDELSDEICQVYLGGIVKSKLVYLPFSYICQIALTFLLLTCR